MNFNNCSFFPHCFRSEKNKINTRKTYTQKYNEKKFRMFSKKKENNIWHRHTEIYSLYIKYHRHNVKTNSKCDLNAQYAWTADQFVRDPFCDGTNQIQIRTHYTHACESVKFVLCEEKPNVKLYAYVVFSFIFCSIFFLFFSFFVENRNEIQHVAAVARGKKCYFQN